MKKLIWILALLTALMFASPSDAMQPEKQHWVCDQMGTMQKSNILTISDVFVATGTAEERETHFSKIVKEMTTKGWQKMFLFGYEPSFDANCSSHYSKDRAEKYRSKKIKKAEKRKFRVFQIIFSRGS